MDYDEAVKLGREAAKSQWTLGDLALSLEPKYGDATLATFADDIGVSLKTMEQYRHVADIYPEKDGRPSIFGLAVTLMAQPDRAELVTTVSTVKEARELVKARKRDTKASEAAEEPQPDRSALEDISPEEVGSPSTRLEEAKEQYIEVPKDKEPPSYKDLTKEQKKNRVAFNVLAGSINEGILALGEAMVQMGNDPEALEWAQEDIRTMKRRILALEEFYTTEMSN